MPWSEQLAAVRVTLVDEAVLGQSQSESDFVAIAVDLVVELASYIWIAANLFRNSDLTWSRNEAIVGGHVVRLYKLLDALLDQTCKHRRETSLVLTRLAFECIVSLRYLLSNPAEELFRSYLTHSLRHELKLLQKIETNVLERGGDLLPIEDRMIRSILASFGAAGVSRADVLENTQRNWGGLNLYEKAQQIGLDEAYLAAFSGTSHSIHGSWQDMLDHNLEKIDDESYRPELKWQMPRPQLLEALVLLAGDAVIDYLDYMTEGNAVDFVDQVRGMQERAHKLSALHEAFLVGRAANG